MVRRRLRKLMFKTYPVWVLLAAMFLALTIIGCASCGSAPDAQDSLLPTATQGTVERGGSNLETSTATIPKLKPRWDVHLSGDGDQLGCAGESLSSVLGE